MSALFKAVSYSIKHWYIPFILGFILLLTGFYIFTVPLSTYLTLSILFSVSFIISGIGDVFFSLQNTRLLSGWGWYLVGGLLSLLMGIFLVFYPLISISILPFVVACTVLFRSFQMLGFSLELKEMSSPYWLSVCLLSLLSVVFSLLLLIYPVFSGISLVAITALSFVFVGFGSIVLSLDLRKIRDYPKKVSTELQNKIAYLNKEIKQTL